MRLARIGVPAAALACLGLATLLLGGPQVMGASLAAAGGAIAAAVGGVAVISPPQRATEKSALAAGALGSLALVGFLLWAVGLL